MAIIPRKKCALPPQLCNDKVWYSPYQFLHTLQHYACVDMLTYSFNPNLSVYCRIGKVVCNKLFPDLPVPEYNKRKGTVYRQCDNLHSKMYICKRDGEINIFVGSWNFNTPSYLEIIVKLPKTENKRAIEYFESIWKQSK